MGRRGMGRQMGREDQVQGETGGPMSQENEWKSAAAGDREYREPIECPRGWDVRGPRTLLG